MRAQTAAWTDRAPVQVSVTRDIEASPDEVFAALADHETWPEWFAVLTQVEPYGEPTTGVGSKRRVVIRHRVRLEEEFIEWVPGRVWSFTVLEASGPFFAIESLNERVTIDEIADGRVRVTYLMAMQPKRGLALLFRRVVRPGAAKTLTSALESLEHRLAERRSGAHG